jgi:transcriptional regulator GlxA family with amidase domain
MARAAPLRDVTIVAFPDFQILDVTGPAEVFSHATRVLEAAGKSGGYRVRLVARARGPLASTSGLSVVAEPLPALPCRTDTLLLTGGRGTRRAVKDAVLIDWIRRTARTARRVTSVCTGAFVLARAGLLDGRRATTHWDSCAALAARHPRVKVEPDRIFVKDGPVYTSAGVTAGIDLALALVEEDHGRELALEIARLLVVFLKRPGGQSQFSTQLATQANDSEPLADLRAWIEDNVGGDLAVPRLARKAGMSPRNFARRFTKEIGVTPARYVQTVRLGAARRRLEETAHGLDRVATDAGFGTTESLRRAFADALGTTPTDYRKRFGTKGKPR